MPVYIAGNSPLAIAAIGYKKRLPALPAGNRQGIFLEKTGWPDLAGCNDIAAIKDGLYLYLYHLEAPMCYFIQRALRQPGALIIYR
jgi:hypothetical protein